MRASCCRLDDVTQTVGTYACNDDGVGVPAAAFESCGDLVHEFHAGVIDELCNRIGQSRVHGDIHVMSGK